MRSAAVQSTAIFAATLLAGCTLVAYWNGVERTERRRATADVAHAAALALEHQLLGSLSAPYALAGVVRHNGGEAGFEVLAAELLRLYPSIDCLELAPDGIIARIYPLRGREAAVGLDLLGDPVRAPAVHAAIESRGVTLDGPFPLRQGGDGLAARVAVFTRRPDGQERFWGIAVAVLQLQALLDASGMSRLLHDGYDYELARGLPGAPSGEPFARSRPGTEPLEDAVAVAIALPTGGWTLSVVPRHGYATLPRIAVGYALAAVAALAFALLAHRVLRQPELLRREVKARTAQLEAAHDEQRRTEASLRQAQKLEAIGLLAGGVAHDFNNVLAGILAYAELIAQEAAPGTIAAEGSRTIQQAARRAEELTARLLAFARAGKNRDMPFDLHTVVREVVRLLGRALDPGIVVEERLEATRTVVFGDPGGLHQIVLNLAVNARDAMPAGGRMTLSTRDEEAPPGDPSLAPGRYVVLTIADTGVGIPPDLQERIFEPFFTTKEEGRGTGMGLATVYGIAKRHGGTVRVRSDVGKGSAFDVYLPSAADPAAVLDSPGSPAHAPAATSGRGRVLVVDDDEMVRRAAVRMVGALGYEPVPLESGERALEWVAAHPGDAAAALLDLSMPGLDGAAVLRRLRDQEPRLPVVVCSGYAKDGRAQDLLDAGAAGFLQKPFTRSELASSLDGALRRPQAAVIPTGT